jgi:hypothetical protein
MSNEQPKNVQAPEDQPSEPENRFEERWERRAARHASRGNTGAWVGGIVIILIGVYLLLSQIQGFAFINNWWALFILIPAVASFAAAWYQFNSAGKRLNRMARGSVIGGLVLTLVAVTFLLNWNWGIVGPLLLIVAGVSIVLNFMLPN